MVLLPDAGMLIPFGNWTLNLPDFPNEPSIVPTSPLAVVTCHKRQSKAETEA